MLGMGCCFWHREVAWAPCAVSHWNWRTSKNRKQCSILFEFDRILDFLSYLNCFLAVLERLQCLHPTKGWSKDVGRNWLKESIGCKKMRTMCSCSSKSVTQLQNGKRWQEQWMGCSQKLRETAEFTPVFTIQMGHPSKLQQLKTTFDGWYRLVMSRGFVLSTCRKFSPTVRLVLTVIPTLQTRYSTSQKERDTTSQKLYIPIFSGSDAVLFTFFVGICFFFIVGTMGPESLPRTRRGVPRRCHAATGAA